MRLCPALSIGRCDRDRHICGLLWQNCWKTDTIAAEFVELAETYANNEEQWVEALGPVQHLTASEPGAALKWVPTAVSVQVHDAVAQMRLRLVSISTLLQDERAAQAIGTASLECLRMALATLVIIFSQRSCCRYLLQWVLTGEKLSLKLCAFFLEKVLWEKPFSVPGVGQLAADVAAASQCIARLLGFGVENGTNESTNLGATSQRSGSVATAQRFMDVDKVIRANSCLREVQVCSFACSSKRDFVRKFPVRKKHLSHGVLLWKTMVGRSACGYLLCRYPF